MITLLEKLRADGSLERLVKAGLVPIKVYGYLEIVMYFDILKRMGRGTCEAVCYCEERFHCSESTVYKALRDLDYANSSNNTDKGGQTALPKATSKDDSGADDSA